MQPESSFCNCNEDAISRLMVEQERHQETFLHDLIFNATGYLKERKLGFTIDDIVNTWKKPSVHKGNAAKIFFAEKIFPSFQKGTTNEYELDYLVVMFLRHVTEVIAFNILTDLNRSRLRTPKSVVPSEK
jgi:hypothetical protein